MPGYIRGNSPTIVETLGQLIAHHDSTEIILQVSRAKSSGPLKNVYLVFSVEDIRTGSSQTIDPYLTYSIIPEEIAQQIREPLAICPGQSLLFLNHNRWICTRSSSVTSTTSSGGGESSERDNAGIEKHFFLPMSWVVTDKFRLCSFVSNGTLLCPKNGELAALKCSSSNLLSSIAGDSRIDLHTAARQGDIRLVKHLINKAGAGVDAMNMQSMTPLLLAAKHGMAKMVELLEAFGVDVNYKCNRGRTSLSWAAGNGHEAVVRLLLSFRGICVDSRDTLGRTPIIWATINGHESVVRVLLSANADIMLSDDLQRTPLIWAVYRGQRSLTDLLLEKRFSIWPDGSHLLLSARDAGHQELVRLLVTGHLENVARRNFCWLLDLQDAGFEGEEIASLVLEAESDPWIAFNELNIHSHKGEIDQHLHQPSCAHRQELVGKEGHLPIDPVALHQRREEMQQCVAKEQKLQSSMVLQAQRKKSEDKISLSTSLDSSENPPRPMLSEFPSSPSRDTPPTTQTSGFSSRFDVLSQLQSAMERFTCAAVSLQEAGFCCDRFMLLTEYDQGSSLPGNVPIVRLVAIPFSLSQRLSGELSAQLNLEINSEPALSRCVSASLAIMDLLFRNSFPLPPSVNQGLHLCSLTVQVLTLGLMLYSQAHTGKLHPFFMREPLTKVILLGHMIGQHFITVEHQRLACIGDMIQDDVLVFRVHSFSPGNLPEPPTPRGASERYYLSATCENIVDLWGPAYLVAGSGTEYGHDLSGLLIRGGIIRPTQDLLGGERLFHWGLESGSLGSLPVTFSYWDNILVGTSTSNVISSSATTVQHTRRTPLATSSSVQPQVLGQQCKAPVQLGINKCCPLSTDESRRESEPYLCRLGTAPDWWSLTEVQGIAALNPPYFTLQGAFAMTKQSGVPLKRLLLDQWIGENSVGLFEEPWGLQMSLCTGVARRVPLRSLIEEPLFRFIDSLNIDGWKTLRARAIPAIQRDHGFLEWTRTLKKEEMQCLRQIFTRLLDVLKDTGFDRSGKHFSILWPHNENTKYCVQIRPDKDHFWCNMLQETEWCATFAVTTSLCLETQHHKCRGTKAASWCGGKLLSTIVCPQLTHAATPSIPTTPSTTLWQLQDGKIYWVGRVGGDIRVVVRKQANSVTELLVKRNRFPVLSRFWPDRVLRERPDVTFHGEEVFVLHR